MNLKFEETDDDNLTISFRNYDEKKFVSWHKLINELIVIDELYPNNKLINYYISGSCNSTHYIVDNQDDRYESHHTGKSLKCVVDEMRRLWEHSGFLNILVLSVNIDLLLD